jgi:hypothetical protein
LLQVFLGQDVFALQQPGLAHAGLRRDIDDETFLEAGQLAWRTKSTSACRWFAALDLGRGQVFDLLAVQPGHVRAVAPDDAGQRRLEPPQAPGAAQDLLDLAVQRGVRLGLLALETFGGRRYRRRPRRNTVVMM